MAKKLTSPQLCFNGINGATGGYLLPPLSAEDVGKIAKGEKLDPKHVQELKYWHQRTKLDHFGPRAGIQPDKLDQAGWGVIFAHDAAPNLLDVLRPLLDLRKQQAGGFYREFTGNQGYRSELAGQPGESKQSFLSRQGMGPGPADPAKVPYYLLLVGDPEAIPFRFQYQLDVQYAVGRIWFDTLEEYACYAQSVVLAETGKVSLPRRAVLFGSRNNDDGATALSADELVRPLAKNLPAKLSSNVPAWDLTTVVGDGATKARLANLLGGDETPTLLFTASHGMGFPSDDPRQVSDQGALLCQDWPGPFAWRGPIPREFYFAGCDVSPNARLNGLISFHFACYGAGTPRLDDFAHQLFQLPTAIAPHAFVANLPRKLLGHSNGGALAVVGHVERAWGCSIAWDAKDPRQIQAFEDVMKILMEGGPVGWAMEFLNQRYADLSSELSSDLEDIKFGRKADDYELAAKWTANNDARSYVIIGDPAVRLPLGVGGSEEVVRPIMAPVVVNTPKSVSSPPVGRDAGSGGAAPSSAGVGPVAPTANPGAGASNAPEAAVQMEQKTMNANVTVAVEAPLSTGGLWTAVPGAAISIPFNLTLTIGPAGPVAAHAAVEGVNASPVAAEAVAPAGPTPFAVTIDSDYGNREGYDSEFLGAGTQEVLLPKLSPTLKADAATVHGSDTGTDPHELKYHHFSVVLNARRRLAFFTAVNIDGRSAKSPKRETDKWIFDPRVAVGEQVGNEFYGKPFDRGHLVRRLDPAWGRSPSIIKIANDDTFHFTNCSPQHARFNEGKPLWAGLEDFLLAKAVDDRKRITVFTGPVFDEKDPTYEGVRIPLRFWKIAVTARPNGRLAALAFVVTQEDLVRPVVSAFAPVDVARTFQVTLRRVEQLTGLDFGRLREFDLESVQSFDVGGATADRPVATFDQIRLDQRSAAGAGPVAPVAFVPAPALAVAAEVPLPPEQVPGTELRYYLMAFDEQSRERPRSMAPTGLVSKLVIDALATQPITDVMLFSHGWMGDVPSAREQYGGWLKAMDSNAADGERMQQARPGFRPLLVGLHWPSLPWGDETFAVSQSFAASGAQGGDPSGGPSDELVEDFAQRLADTLEGREKARGPLREIFAAVSRAAGIPEQLPQDLTIAYKALNDATGLLSAGSGADPGADRDPFDPEGIYKDVRSVVDAGGHGSAMSFGFRLPSRDDLLAPLRALSFWKMKDRARQFGERAVNPFLSRLQAAVAGRSVRFHLMGHSFGCIVASAAIAGKPGSSKLPQPVDSLALVQGALSLWSYCSAIPSVPAVPGYFHSIFAEGRVRGPVVTTQSRYDTAVGTWYPRAAGARGQIVFAAGQLPKYGAVGTYGIQGPGLQVSDEIMLPTDGAYALSGGRAYNFNGSDYIREGGGFSGAHSDIRRPEVAHLIWAAMTV